ncbi:MAG: DUF502 domain-containing protein [Bacteroidales bacterium]|nr:DUF502 domain-containing protein [Bacteroidales bacterium]
MNQLLKQILALFFQGLLYVTPIFIPLYIIYSIFNSIDNNIKEWLNIDVPGLGLVVAFILISLIGWLGKMFITQPIKHELKKLLDRAPLIKVIYNSVQDLLKAFVGKEKKFNQPVLVNVNPMTNLEKLGFITQEDLSDFQVEEGKIAVYFPHSYAFSGELYIVPKTQVKIIDKKSAEVMKFIVSAGVSKS